MIGLVLVSHSLRLAEGVTELISQMVDATQVAVAVAGGIDDPENPIGTDPMRVVEAINEVYSDAGVIILMDLGSALMSAETALEFLDPAQQANIYLSEAPFVEGALSAAIQAASGSTVQEILQAAGAALGAKQQHLGTAVTNNNTIPPAQTAPSANAQHIEITVPNKLGLHARPAARLVGLTGKYNALLTIQKGDHYANAGNINQVTLLNARQGDILGFFAEGQDAAAVLQAVRNLAHDNFGDRDNGAIPTTSKPPATPTDTPADVLAGVSAARGLAIGPVFMLDEQLPDLPTHTISDTHAQIERLQQAIQQAITQLQAITSKTARRIGQDEAAIFDAHVMILQDQELIGQVEDSIQTEQQPAEAAWWQVINRMAQQYRDTDNPYIQARAVDVLDVGKRVLRQLTPSDTPAPQVPTGCILAAPDLTPSDTAQLNPEKVRGILTQHGGATSHTAIIARSLGIPAVVGLGAGYTQIAHDQQIVIDGDNGWIYPAPTPAQVRSFQKQIDTHHTEQQALLRIARQAATTQDGHTIEIAANVGNPAETETLAARGAEGIGLFRTELLFMGRPHAPDETQQTEAYRQAVANMHGYPVIIRTLDVGGDKAIDYIHIDPEENPFLGHRGIRYWLSNEPLARTQLRAICRASAAGEVRVMFPMVGTLEELQAARALLDDVQAELQAAGTDYDPHMQVGVMIEVPSAVLAADLLAAHVDFFSIGTNDLTQYIMAADRGNAQVNTLATPFQPAVLRAIQQVTDAAHHQGKWVGMCGEMAGNPAATRLLLGLGLDELSMSAPSIPQVKAVIRQASYQQAQALAERVLQMQTAAEVLAALE
jgi:multiphosphoryl transfer protein